MEFTLLFAALTAFVMMWVGTRIWTGRLPERPLDDLVGSAVVGLFVGRIAAMVAQGINPFINPLDIIIVRGGVHTGAAAIGAISALAWASRNRLANLDSLAPAALLGLAGWHTGCLWRGACLGTASDLPWAWSGPVSEITRHPVELYAAVALVASAWLVGRLPWRILLKSGSALGLAGLVRLITEPMRPSLSGGPIGWYLAAVIVGLAAALVAERLAGEVPASAPT